MKVAIIGAGFYGCYLERAFKRTFGNEILVEIFDRDERPFSRAATNNQSRLHLGFHYPRSKETIAQTVSGYREFAAEFAECIYFPSHNLYAIRRNGHISLGEYLRVMDEFKLEYEFCGFQEQKYFRKPELLEGVIRVKEAVIDLRKLKSKMLMELKSKIRCSSLVTNVDSANGTLTVNGKVQGPYDFIVNTTYVDPNLGLPMPICFDLKYELAAMVLKDAPFSSDVALTVMDGPFVSLYPCSKTLATLSSVVHTPFAKYNQVCDLETNYKDAKRIAEQLDIRNKILTHGEQELNIDRRDLKCHGLWIAPKAKLQGDDGDTRISAIRCDGRLISVLCGKLDAVRDISEQVLGKLAS